MTARVPDFPTLERTVSMVARHPFFPGKPDVVRECLDDVERWFREGALSESQRARLVSLLMPA